MKFKIIIFLIFAVTLCSTNSYAKSASPKAQYLYDQCKKDLSITKDRNELLFSYCEATITSFWAGYGWAMLRGFSNLDGESQELAISELQNGIKKKQECSELAGLPNIWSSKDTISFAEYYVAWVEKTEISLSIEISDSLYGLFYTLIECGEE